MITLTQFLYLQADHPYALPSRRESYFPPFVQYFCFHLILIPTIGFPTINYTYTPIPFLQSPQEKHQTSYGTIYCSNGNK